MSLKNIAKIIRVISRYIREITFYTDKFCKKFRENSPRNLQIIYIEITFYTDKFRKKDFENSPRNLQILHVEIT